VIAPLLVQIRDLRVQAARGKGIGDLFVVAPLLIVNKGQVKPRKLQGNCGAESSN
jgi:hypothetical protein